MKSTPIRGLLRATSILGTAGLAQSFADWVSGLHDARFGAAEG